MEAIVLGEIKFKCACCEQNTLEIEDFYEVCPVCGWEDDSSQNETPDMAGGANQMSLNEAKEAYKKGLPVK